MLSVVFRKSLPILNNSVKAASIFTHKMLYESVFRVSRSCYATIHLEKEKHAFAISYLMKSLGFSHELATKLASTGRLNFEIPETPDLVLNLFEKHGFTKSQVYGIIKRFPQTLSYNAENTLSPKFEFLSSKGLSNNALVKLVSLNPQILLHSLERHIIPYYNFLKTTVCSDDKVLLGLRYCRWTLSTGLQSHAMPNIATLRGIGVPQSVINHLVIWHPLALMTSSDQFNDIVEEVKQFGINPSVVTFVMAVRMKRGMSKATWEKKLNIYRKWGWSDKQILTAFCKNPQCMMCSEEKITATMNFFVNELGFDSLVMARLPRVLNFSLENRIIPRCLVLNALLSKGLPNMRISLSSLLTASDKIFMLKYISCYENEASNLLKLYNKKLDPAKSKQELNILAHFSNV